MALLIFTDNYPPQSGGIGTYAYELAKNLHAEGVEVMVCAPGSKGAREMDSREKFITYRIVRKRPLFELHALLLLFYLTLRGRVDRALCMTWHPCGSLAMLTNFLFNVPYYVVAHGSEFLEPEEGLLNRLKYGWFLRPLKRLVLGRASTLFTYSYTKRLLMALGADEKKIVLVRGGTDPEKFQPVKNRGEVARRYGLEGKKVLLTVARLAPHKGQDTIISLMPELIKKIPNLVYVIVGVGSQEATLKDMVSRLNLNGYVLFTGPKPVEELPGLYSVCDVFVMVSKEIPSFEFEGFGIAFLEANACGKPVIGGKSGGIPEAVLHGQTGLLVDPNNPKEIIGAIVKLLTDDSLARELGERGRQRVIGELNWRTAARRIKDVIYA
ncbi:MAG: glycosyltransferase family 4 protein [Candidatus Brocadiales bacterium]